MCSPLPTAPLPVVPTTVNRLIAIVADLRCRVAEALLDKMISMSSSPLPVGMCVHCFNIAPGSYTQTHLFFCFRLAKYDVNYGRSYSRTTVRRWTLAGGSSVLDWWTTAADTHITVCVHTAATDSIRRAFRQRQSHDSASTPFTPDC